MGVGLCRQHIGDDCRVYYSPEQLLHVDHGMPDDYARKGRRSAPSLRIEDVLNFDPKHAYDISVLCPSQVDFELRH